MKASTARSDSPVRGPGVKGEELSAPAVCVVKVIAGLGEGMTRPQTESEGRLGRAANSFFVDGSWHGESARSDSERHEDWIISST